MVLMACEQSTRRSFIAGASAACAAAVAPRPAAAADGPRVLLIGGSQIAGAFGMYLRKALMKSGYVVRREAKSASGLARPDFFNWPRLTAALLASFEPDAVVVMFGANDAQGIRMPRGSDPRWLRWHEPEWIVEYRRRIRDFAELLAPDHARQLFWLGMPAMGEPRLDARVQVINEAYATHIESRESGFYIETRPVLADEHGDFVDHMQIDGDRVRIRAHDGVHIRGPGATRLVQHVKPIIERHLRIVPTRTRGHA